VLARPAIALFAFLLELAIAYPGWIYRRIGHPVSWIGAGLSVLELVLNRDGVSFAFRRLAGVTALVLLLLCVGGVALALHLALLQFPGGWVVEFVGVAALVAPRNLRDHVRAVAEALESHGLSAGRRAVSQIVGRDTEALDESGVCRAAIESLAENFSDGVIAPLFWYLAGGLIGIALYKAINTADSMIGHRNARYEAFGWAAARLDDLVNLPAARLSALLIAGGACLERAASGRRALATAWRDASHHRSPNAGWPEAAMAGALGVALAGPRIYEGHSVEEAWLGDGSRHASVGDLCLALGIYDRALLLIVIVLALGALSRL